jgi:hypothetical protein
VDGKKGYPSPFPFLISSHKGKRRKGVGLKFVNTEIALETNPVLVVRAAIMSGEEGRSVMARVNREIQTFFPFCDCPCLTTVATRSEEDGQDVSTISPGFIFTFIALP